MNTLMTTLACLALIVGESLASDLRWTLSSGGGFDSNPAGYDQADMQALGWSKLNTRWSKDLESGSVRIAYDGIGYSYLPESAWSGHRHGLTATYQSAVSSDFRYDLGTTVAGSWNHPDFTAHSYREIEGHAATLSKHAGWNAVTKLKLGVRSYPESPEFDYRHVTLSATARRSFVTRTTIGGGVEFASRLYTTQTIEDTFDGILNARSSRYRVDGFLGQGLTTATGIKFSLYAENGNGRSRWRDDYWQVLDDPLATSGIGGRIQLSWLAPAGLTIRTYGELDALDESYIASDGAYARRDDDRLGGGVSMQGILPWFTGSNSTSFTVGVETERNWSTDASYSYEQLSVMAGLMYAW
jgi:hypothetical protein